MVGTDGNFALVVSRVQRELLRQGLNAVDMRRAPALELQYAGAADLAARPGGRGRVGFEPLEGPIEQRPVPRPTGPTRIRAFLDGAQRTLPAMLLGTVPVAVTIAAGAVLERDERGICQIRPGTLRMRKAWLVPNLPDHADVQGLRDHLAGIGAMTVDTLASLHDADGDADDLSALASDYTYLTELAYRTARKVREELERDLLLEWEAARKTSGSDEWIVVDGRLRGDVQNAIGLVKQFSETHLTGQEAELLLQLPEGHRTTAFHPTDRRRGGANPEARTLWYLRLWSAQGLDARHALLRVETHESVTSTDEIDRISSWVLSERTPRAIGDDRWAVLLYPIHLLERALKRQVEADCRGWPGA